MRALGIWRVLTFYGAMGLIGLIGMNETHLRHLLPHSQVAWPWALLAGLASGLALVASSRLAAARVRSMRRLAHEFRALVAGCGRRDIVLMALVSGVSEEILFRGALQPALGLGLTTGIFGLLHIGPSRRFVPWTLMALVGGAIFGGLFVWSGSLLAPILAHITVNLLNLRYLASPSSLLRSQPHFNAKHVVPT